MDGTYEYVLDIFGQHPGLHNLYTQITLIYAVPKTSSTEPSPNDTGDPLVSTISTRLTNALKRLTASVPWISGQVVHAEDPQQRGRETYKVVPLDEIPRLVIKDLRRSDEHEHPELTMKALRQANFPFSLLDENVIAPRNTLMAPGDVCPVFLVQATILPSGESEGGAGDGKEGLLLTFVALHNAMDMTGLGWIIGLLDRLCKGGDLTPEERDLANLDRRDIPKPLDLEPNFTVAAHDKQDSREGSDAKGSDGTSESTQDISTPNCRWAYITFSAFSLSEMKALAVSHGLSTSQGPGVTDGKGDTHIKNPIPSFVSTDDVLTAFIFQSIARARIPRLTTHAPFTFARAIDPRRFLDIHTSYPGVVQCMTYHTYSPQDIADKSLGSLAADLRAALRPSPMISTALSTTSPPTTGGDIAYRTRRLATDIFHSPHDPSSSVTSSLDLTRDVMLSSWANRSALWTHDFGLGLGIGTPESVRRPAFLGVESLCYIMPRDARDGGRGEVAVAVCLRDEDVERMKDDENVKRWGKWVG